MPLLGFGLHLPIIYRINRIESHYFLRCMMAGRGRKTIARWTEQYDKIEMTIEFLGQDLGHTTNVSLASFFGVQPSTVSDWRKRENQDGARGVNPDKFFSAIERAYDVETDRQELMKATASQFGDLLITQLAKRSSDPSKTSWRVLDQVHIFSNRNRLSYQYFDRYWYVEKHIFGEVIKYLRLPMVFFSSNPYWKFRFQTRLGQLDVGGVFDFGPHQFMMFLDNYGSRAPRCSILQRPFSFPSNSGKVGAINGHIVSTYSKTDVEIYSGQFVLIADQTEQSDTGSLKPMEYVSEGEFYDTMSGMNENGLFNVNDPEAISRNAQALEELTHSGFD